MLGNLEQEGMFSSQLMECHLIGSHGHSVHKDIYKHHYMFFKDYTNPLVTHVVLLLRDLHFVFVKQRRKLKIPVIYLNLSLGLTFGR